MLSLRNRLVLILLILAIGGAARAQDYSFRVPKMQMFVSVNPDASVKIEYFLTFQNEPAAHAIDVVDIGLPHADYDLSTMSAKIGGHPCKGIAKSEYVPIGVQVPLGEHAIPPGKSSKFDFACTMPNMVYQDTTRKDHASLEVTPTWFESNLLKGSTDLEVAISAPEGVKPEELLYQTAKFTRKAIFSNRSVAYWRWQQTRVDAAHTVGLSFPKRVMQRVVPISRFTLLAKWYVDQFAVPFEGHPTFRFFTGLTFLGLLVFLFYRFSGCTGGCLVIPVLFIAFIVAVVSPSLHLLSWPPLLLLVYFNERRLHYRKQHYLPPIVSVEGGGIKRGLTAPEAAVLLELPPSKVLTLVLFGMLKKGLVKQVRTLPLQVEVEPSYSGEDEPGAKGTSPAGETVHPYERDFISCLLYHKGKEVADIDFEYPMVKLIARTLEKMKGFNLEETREYYRSIVGRAWAEAEALGEIPERDKAVDRNLEWLLMSRDYEDRFEHWHSKGYDYEPSWTRVARPAPQPPTPAPTPSAPSPVPSGPGGKTSFRDVASSFAGWTENVMGSAAVKVDSASAEDHGVVAHLSGFQRAASDFFKSLSESSGSSGGGGRAGGGGGRSCACACAGCACACACAGGGR